MPGTPSKRPLQPRAPLGLQRQRLARLPQRQQTVRRENGRQHHHDGCVHTISRISFPLIGVIVVKFIRTKREFGKFIIGSEVTLQNPDIRTVALFTHDHEGCTW